MLPAELRIEQPRSPPNPTTPKALSELGPKCSIEEASRTLICAGWIKDSTKPWRKAGLAEPSIEYNEYEKHEIDALPLAAIADRRLPIRRWQLDESPGP